MSSFRPLHDRVLVKPVKEDVSKGGIVIPDNAKEKPSRGTVEAVGPGKLDDNGHRSPMDVKKETQYCTENIPVPRSSSTTTSSSCYAKKIF